MRFFVITTIIICLLWNSSYATNYYISSFGNDNNNGLAPASAWKTIDRINNVTFTAGDSILLRSGEIFFTSGIHIKNSGTVLNPIVISSYGTGDKPTITGFMTSTSWTNLGGNIWESNAFPTSIPYLNLLTFNGVNTAMGRTPNADQTQWTYTSHSGKGQFTSSNLVGGTTWVNAELVVYITTYGVNKGKILTHNTGNGTVTYEYDPIQENVQSNNQPMFIQNDVRTLDIQNEWYFNPVTKRVTVYSVSNPLNTVKIAATEQLMLIENPSGDISNVTVNGIKFEGSNSTSLSPRRAFNLRVQNCDFDFSGIDAIYSPYWGPSSGLVVENCSFNNTNNTAIGLTEDFINSVFKGNTIKNTGNTIGMTARAGEHSYTGFATGLHSKGEKTLIENNIVVNTGYTGITFTGDSSVVRYNIVDTACTFLHDGGGIYTWNGTLAQRTGQKIYKNVVKNVYNNCGIYADDGQNNIEIYDNTVINCKTGIYLHNTWQIYVHHNNVIGSTSAALNVWNDDASVTMYGGNIEYNNFITQGNRVAFVLSYEGVRDGFNLNNNRYVRVGGGKEWDGYTASTSTWQERSLQEWKYFSGKDASSVNTPNSSMPVTLVNELPYTATVTLDGTYQDLSGGIYDGAIELQGFESRFAFKISSGGNISVSLPANYSVQTTYTSLSASVTGGSGHYSFLWEKISGGSAEIDNEFSQTINITGLQVGIYKFKVTVTDSNNETAQAEVTVTVTEEEPPYHEGQLRLRGRVRIVEYRNQ